MELAIACDLTVSSEECLFGLPEVRFGSGIVAMLAPWLAGPKHAKYLLLTGDSRVTAREVQEEVEAAAEGEGAEAAPAPEAKPKAK